MPIHCAPIMPPRQLSLFDNHPIKTVEYVIISRCILGIPCRYHGKTTAFTGKHIGRPALVTRLQKHYTLITICPEVDAGLPIPRPPSTVVRGRVWMGKRNEPKIDVTSLFVNGAKLALGLALQHNCQRAYLLNNSPACGKEYGITALLLAENNIRIIGV